MASSQLETVQLEAWAWIHQVVPGLSVETPKVATPGQELLAFLAEQQELQASPVEETVELRTGPGPSQVETAPESSWECHGPL